ncbi:hypothetical protein HDE_10011 [Halotydeus destructor]|nr:hypothetical protein HDE_10011 [Halotydeus destructor]
MKQMLVLLVVVSCLCYITHAGNPTTVGPVASATAANAPGWMDTNFQSSNGRNGRRRRRRNNGRNNNDGYNDNGGNNNNNNNNYDYYDYDDTKMSNSMNIKPPTQNMGMGFSTNNNN